MAVVNVNIAKTYRLFVIFFLIWNIWGFKNEQKRSYAVDIFRQLKSSCVILIQSTISSSNPDSLLKLFSVFQDDPLVSISVLNITNFTWPNGEGLEFEEQVKFKSAKIALALLPKQKVDRTCLLDVAYEWYPKAKSLIGIEDIDTVIEFINNECGTYKTSRGTLNIEGQHREAVLSSLFSVSTISNATMKTLQGGFHKYCYKDSDETCGSVDKTTNIQFGDTLSSVFKPVGIRSENHTGILQNVLPKCERKSLSDLSWEIFFENYLSKSKPVVIENVTTDWEAFTKWTTDYLRHEYGSKKVHVKLTPGGDFEGVEPASLWEDFETFTIPEKVKHKLEFPDLVVVRPAGVNMNFSEFLDLITWAASQESRNVSAYLEYSSIPEHLPGLEKDIKDFKFVNGKLKRRHLNIWLSDGNTLGRLHFDPFDNLLCQLKGKKQVILFEPHDNRKLYEAHIPQATLKYNKHLKQFRRRGLEDSTSMVMSPVDIHNPNLERFPLFGETLALNCTIDEGDVLFMPSFWWHEVYSLPNREEKRNMAVNFWFEPFLQKEFPCPECKLDVNPFYRHLL